MRNAWTVGGEQLAFTTHVAQSNSDGNNKSNNEEEETTGLLLRSGSKAAGRRDT